MRGEFYALCSISYSSYRSPPKTLLQAFLRWLRPQGISESKLCVNVPTGLFYEHTFLAHNKQGGCVGISFPTDLEKYMSARP